MYSFNLSNVEWSQFSFFMDALKTNPSNCNILQNIALKYTSTSPTLQRMIKELVQIVRDNSIKTKEQLITTLKSKPNDTLYRITLSLLSI